MGAGLLAVANERIAYRPIRIRNSSLLYLMISSLGVAIFLENFTIVTIGPNFRTYPPVLPTAAQSCWDRSASDG